MLIVFYSIIPPTLETHLKGVVLGFQTGFTVFLEDLQQENPRDVIQGQQDSVLARR